VEEGVTSESATTLDEVVRRRWDVVVIGAGPAGALAARQASQSGLAALLIEAKRWPRDKVCGGCLNGRALALLERSGLTKELEGCGGAAVDRLCLVVGSRTTEFALPRGMAVSRALLDRKLVDAAVRAGATFLAETAAVVDAEVADGCRHVALRSGGKHEQVEAGVIIAADGLTRASLKLLPECASRISTDSRVGVGAILEDSGAECLGGRIVMVVSHRGYVGLTRVEGGRLNVAAALDPAVLQRGLPVGEVVAAMLAEAKLPVPENLISATWHGTPPLTNHPNRVAGERLFLVGDAAGYVEPFTGEGIAAALESASAVMPIAARAYHSWEDSLALQWERTHWRMVRERQTTCRRLAWMLRHPAAVSVALAACRAYPSLARRVISKINRPTSSGELASLGQS
jgi:flavin-dependent dehydrogenase